MLSSHNNRRHTITETTHKMANEQDIDFAEWAVVVPPSDFETADRRWLAWVGLHGRPADGDVRVDTFTSSTSNSRRRYLVRKGSTSDRGTPSALNDAGRSASEIAATALALGWDPMQIIVFLRTQMAVALGDAKEIVLALLPEDVQLANAQLRAVAAFWAKVSLDTTEEAEQAIDRLEAQTDISQKLRALVTAGRPEDVGHAIERFDTSTGRFTELTRAQARKIVADYVTELDFEGDLIVLDGQEYDFGWTFFYQSAEYVRTSDVSAQLVGHGPSLVDRYTAALWATGSAFSERLCVANYRATGDPTRLPST